MANKRKPDGLHVVNGTYRADRHGDPTEKPEIAELTSLDAPDFLTAEGRTEWSRITRLFETTGILKESMVVTLSAYCNLAGKLKRNPDTFTAAEYTQLRLLAGEFGLTPASEGNLRLPTGGKDKGGSRFRR